MCRCSAGGLLLLFIAACSGCSSGIDAGGRVAVAGLITLDDAPVSEGRVTFIPHGESDNPAAAGPIAAGKFDIPIAEGPKPGDYVVRITVGSMRRDSNFNGEKQKRFEQPVTIMADMSAGLNIELATPPSQPANSR